MDAVIISDYAKGVVTQPLVDLILGISRKRTHLLVAIDPKPSRKLSFQGAGLITPNRSEALALAGIAESGNEEPYPLEEICERIHALYQPRQLVVTLGADGMAICHEGRLIEHLPTAAREVFDVSGAGDTVIATLTAALASGAELSTAVRLANAAAGCVVGHMGTVPVDLKELKCRLQQKEKEQMYVV